MFVCKPEDLKEGMVLAAPLVTLTNITLLNKGDAIDERIVRHLKIVRVNQIWVEGDPDNPAMAGGGEESAGTQEIRELGGTQNMSLHEKKSLLIRGNVGKGSNVSTLGNLWVVGRVEEAVVSAEGDIHVTEGVRGEADVSSGRRFYAKFVDGSQITARGDVLIQENLINANVNAGGSVVLMDDHSRIMGGIVKAQVDLVAGRVGSDKGIETQVELSSRGLHEMVMQLQKQKKEIQRGDADEKKELTRLQSKPQSELNPNEKRRFQELMDKFAVLDDKVKVIEKRIDEIKALTPPNNPRMMVKGVVYPEVRITIGKSALPVTEENEAQLFREERGEVILEPLDTTEYEKVLAKGRENIPALPQEQPES